MQKKVTCKKSNYNILVPLKRGRSLIYNSLSQGFSLFTKREYECFKETDNFAVPIEKTTTKKDKFYKGFLKQGFVIPMEVGELEVIKANYQNARDTSEVLMLTIAPTIGCNFACDYCFQEHDNKSGMSEEVQNKIVEFIEYFAKIKPNQFKNLHICWYGGEPLIKYKIIKKLSARFIKFCNDNGIKYSAEIVTNGYLLSKEVAKGLYEYGVNKCQITIDGAAKSHDARRHLLSKKGTFDKIISNIQSYINEVPLFTSIRVNIDKRNVAEVSELLHYLAEIKLNNNNNLRVYFSPVESTTSACKSIESFTLEKTELANAMFNLYIQAVELGLHSVTMPPNMMGLCTAVRKNGFIISPTGECHKCFDLITYSKYSIGSIFDYKKLISAIDDENAKKWAAFSPLKNEVCRSCKILPNCMGACPLKFVHKETVNGKTILPCPDLKFNIKETLIHIAIKSGYITDKDFNGEKVKTNPLELSLAAKFHTIENMRLLKEHIIEEVL